MLPPRAARGGRLRRLALFALVLLAVVSLISLGFAAAGHTRGREATAAVATVSRGIAPVPAPTAADTRGLGATPKRSNNPSMRVHFPSFADADRHVEKLRELPTLPTLPTLEATPALEPLVAFKEQEPQAELPASAVVAANASRADVPPANASASVGVSPEPPNLFCGASLPPRQRTELAGDVVKWGDDHLVVDAGACCSACSALPSCSVWVFSHPLNLTCDGVSAPSDASPPCGAPRPCWLKSQRGLLAPFATAPGVLASGPTVAWTSGVLPGRLAQPPPEAAAPPLRPIDASRSSSVPPPRRRECGSPAVDGYSLVDPACLLRSATAAQHDHSAAARAAMVAWGEEGASYDGLAVRWGIGHKQPTPGACAEACRRHVADGHEAEAGAGGAGGAGAGRRGLMAVRSVARPASSRRLGAHGGQFGALPCNVWVFCPVGNDACFEPDAHKHTGGDCWLKARPSLLLLGCCSAGLTRRRGVIINPILNLPPPFTSPTVFGVPRAGGGECPRHHAPAHQRDIPRRERVQRTPFGRAGHRALGLGRPPPARLGPVQRHLRPPRAVVNTAVRTQKFGFPFGPSPPNFARRERAFAPPTFARFEPRTAVAARARPLAHFACLAGLFRRPCFAQWRGLGRRREGTR